MCQAVAMVVLIHATRLVIQGAKIIVRLAQGIAGLIVTPSVTMTVVAHAPIIARPLAMLVASQIVWLLYYNGVLGDVQQPVRERVKYIVGHFAQLNVIRPAGQRVMLIVMLPALPHATLPVPHIAQ